MRDGLALPQPRLVPLTQAVVAVGGSAATFALAYQLAGGHTHLVAAVIGIGGLAATFRWTRQAFYAWVALTATVLPSRIVPIGLGGVRSDLPEALAFALMALVVMRWGMGDRLRRPALAGPLLVLAGAAIVGAGISSTHGGGRDVWLGPLKSLLLY